MYAISILRTTPIIIALVLCSCQSPPHALPSDAQVAIRNETHFPDYLWDGRGSTEYPTIPQPVIQTGPVYPRELKGRGLRGTATIVFVIEPDGSTSHVQIMKASNRYFGDSAKTAIEQWKFTAALFKGKAVAIRATQEMEITEVK